MTERKDMQNLEELLQAIPPEAAGLDPGASEEMYELVAGLNREGITILMVSHDLQAAEKYARHILRIGEPVFWGTKEEYHAAMGKGGSQDA